jgi:hypothetical protein
MSIKIIKKGARQSGKSRDKHSGKEKNIDPEPLNHGPDKLLPSGLLFLPIMLDCLTKLPPNYRATHSAATPSSLHVAANPAGTHLRGIVEAPINTVPFLASQHRLAVPPTHWPRLPPRGRVVADESAYVYTRSCTYATYSYNLVVLYRFCIGLRIPF